MAQMHTGRLGGGVFKIRPPGKLKYLTRQIQYVCTRLKFLQHHGPPTQIYLETSHTLYFNPCESLVYGSMNVQSFAAEETYFLQRQKLKQQNRNQS